MNFDTHDYSYTGTSIVKITFFFLNSYAVFVRTFFPKNPFLNFGHGPVNEEIF